MSDREKTIGYLEDTIRRFAVIEDVTAGEWIERHLRMLREADADLVGEIASLKAELAEARKWQEHYELAASDRAGEVADLQEELEDAQGVGREWKGRAEAAEVALRESDDMLRGWVAQMQDDPAYRGMALSTDTILREHGAGG